MVKETDNAWQQLQIMLDGCYYPPENGVVKIPEGIAMRQELESFLNEWYDDSPTLTVHTSGSTGTPKVLTVRKIQMMNSARITCDFLKLKRGDRAFLCMPLKYIAGKMMVVRALVAGLDLTVCEPTGHPLAEDKGSLRFAAMIPLQVYNSLQIPDECERLQGIADLIIGGGAIDKALSDSLRPLPNRIYSTYGMTETLSHIALRRLNGDEATEYYQPFPSVHLTLSPEQTLIIDAPLVSDEKLITNDVVELRSDGSFAVLGRKDNIINSGGIKIQTECVENVLHSIISVNFALTSVPHPKFGEALTLLLEEGDKNTEELQETVLQEKIRQLLPKYQQPKYILKVKAIPQTETGKISRAECRKLASLLIEKQH